MCLPGRVNDSVREWCGVTTDTALRLARTLVARRSRGSICDGAVKGKANRGRNRASGAGAGAGAGAGGVKLKKSLNKPA